MSTRYTRQLDLIDTSLLQFPIHILGAGGIGSWTTLLLAKMGCPYITLYDDDKVEEHNIASQFYKEKDLNLSKSVAIRKNILEQTGININIAPISIEHEIKDGLIIITIDSMERRNELSQIFKDRNLYIIDGRMGGLQLEIYCYPTQDYPKTIVPLRDVSHDACTGRSICFNCAVIGGLIANYVRLYSQKKIKNSSITFGFNDILLLKE